MQPTLLAHYIYNHVIFPMNKRYLKRGKFDQSVPPPKKKKKTISPGALEHLEKTSEGLSYQ